MTDIAVRPLDVLDDAEFTTAYDVFARAERHGRGEYASVVGPGPLRTLLTRPTSIWARTAWAAWRGTSIVGVATVAMPLSDNQHLGYGAVSVAPEHRRGSVGSALLDKVEDSLRRAGRRTAVVEVNYPTGAGDWPGIAFAKSRGYAMALHEAHQVLDLPAAIDLDVDARDGYRVVSWRDRCPDEWAEAYCRLMADFVEQAPTGELDLEASDWTVERLRESEADMAARGRRFFVSAGVSPDGDLVGYTEIGAPAGNPDAHQDETLVDPAHRGHGLGLALKAANLAALRAALPDRTRVHTHVSPTNEAMNRVNDVLGFRPVEICEEWQRTLTRLA